MKKVSKKALNKSFWNWYYGHLTCFSQEHMQTFGYLCAMLPIVEDLYDTKEEQAAALETYKAFFNTEPQLGSVIVGVTVGLEEARANNEGVDGDTINGLRAGLMTAIAYGFLQLVSDPYIISIPQMLVDYIFAFGAPGLSGLFSKSKNGLVKGYIAGVLGRYFFAFLSGMIFFGAYAADYGMSAPVYSLVYNGIYLSVEAVLTLIILYLPPVKKVMGQLKTMATQR